MWALAVNAFLVLNLHIASGRGGRSHKRAGYSGYRAVLIGFYLNISLEVLRPKRPDSVRNPGLLGRLTFFDAAHQPSFIGLHAPPFGVFLRQNENCP